MEIVSHECYHLFMRILGFVDDRAYTFKELNAEIYAYKFGELGKRVLLALKAMPYYKVLEKNRCVKRRREDDQLREDKEYESHFVVQIHREAERG